MTIPRPFFEYLGFLRPQPPASCLHSPTASQNLETLLNRPAWFLIFKISGRLSLSRRILEHWLQTQRSTLLINSINPPWYTGLANSIWPKWPGQSWCAIDENLLDSIFRAIRYEYCTSIERTLTSFACVALHLFVHGAHSRVVDTTEIRKTLFIIDSVDLDLDNWHALDFLGSEETKLHLPHFVQLDVGLGKNLSSRSTHLSLISNYLIN